MSLFDTVIVQPILNLLMAIYAIVPGSDFGISVVIFTIIIRFLLWPLIKKQLNQAKAMRKMQPELQKLKVKYKNNRQAQGLAMMELYKKHNISPFGSIGVMLIQLPILIGMYRVVQIFVMNRAVLSKYTYGFMQDLPTVKGLLANPDSFNPHLLGFLDLTKQAVSSGGIIWGLVLLALAAAGLQFFTSKQMSPQAESQKRLRDILAEASAGKEVDQAEVNAIMMQKMMKFMPIMLFFIMINLPGALALYLATGNAMAFFQNKIILSRDEEAQSSTSSKPSSGKSDNGRSPATAKQRAERATKARITKIKAKE